MMVFYKFLTLMWLHFSYKAVSFPVIFFTGKYDFILPPLLYPRQQQKKKRKENQNTELCSRSNIFKKSVSSNLAQLNTDYCPTFTKA